MAINASVLILNGPNLNMLGVREPQIYGSLTLDDVEAMCQEHSQRLGLEVDFRQSNHEGELVTWIQQARSENDGIIINAGAYSHTSLAILDALILAELPVVEVHLSNIFKREPFRHHSHVTSVARGMICGFGPQGYVLGLDAMAQILNNRS
ncbi:3-dehydroquinate dehydratase-2 [Azospirillum fermentarium]|uniref:type II 3-dehydroquinate dehydratase n=1 Tax=Azospirillum fermentarium TaxID=1233114 RepID=UPI0022269BE8|nr:type II 3-dehydroquinate dehydratase [Azospirillum fermentarium]MCW2246905.1 3-dehydroquinate dehydratase-2 [Azospirillum fermentarium]